VTAPAVDMTAYLRAIVLPTVADVYRKFGDYVDFDDLVQEAAVWWYGRGQKYLTEYLTEDENHVRLRRSIWRHCAGYAQKEKAARLGYLPGDQYRYSPAEIIAMLPFALDPEGIPQGGHPEGPKPKGNLAEGNDLLAALVDVRRAAHALDEDDLHFVQLVTDLRSDWDQIATHTGTLADSVRRRHARIAERMARWLNNDLEVSA
jgi:DNA-directed RNA polymerase specialized sigma24 family protein